MDPQVFLNAVFRDMGRLGLVLGGLAAALFFIGVVLRPGKKGKRSGPVDFRTYKPQEMASAPLTPPPLPQAYASGLTPKRRTASLALIIAMGLAGLVAALTLSFMAKTANQEAILAHEESIRLETAPAPQEREALAPRPEAPAPASEPEDGFPPGLKALMEQGAELLQKNDNGSAEAVFRQALALVQQTGEAPMERQCDVFSHLAQALRNQGREDEAEVYFYRAVAAAGESGDPEGVCMAGAKSELARLCLRQGRFRDGAALSGEAVRLWDKLQGPGNANSVSLILEQAAFLEKAGRSLEAAEARERAARFRNSTGYAEHQASADEEGVTTVTASLSRDFEPVLMSPTGPAAACLPRTDHLTAELPAGITREPEYLGLERRYGKLDLGMPQQAYYFALDRSTGPHPVIYFDANGNSDLTDDGPPILNQGTGFFAAALYLPLSQVLRGFDGPEDFVVWFFLNEEDWGQGAASHYSRTQMRGRVTVGRKDHLVWLAETKVNDGDFTNDGIYLDINGDGKIQPEAEYIAPGRKTGIGGATYRFIITP